jgi:chemotaxis response regulator CheB
MIQDRESSVVWGMPGAVHAIGAYDNDGSIDECARILKQMVS